MRFSNWVKFDQRDELRNLNYPGVYAIAISPRNIAGAQFRWIKEISYVGSTNPVGGLRGRLYCSHGTWYCLSGGGGFRLLTHTPRARPSSRSRPHPALIFVTGHGRVAWRSPAGLVRETMLNV